LKLYEFLAKEIMSKAGIPVPKGMVARTAQEAESAAQALGAVALKAQVLAGGRGKAGGIAFASTPEEARAAAERLLGTEIRGLRVDTILVEERLSIDAELYLGLTVDAANRAPLCIASARGGMDIEEVPVKDIVKVNLHPSWGLGAYKARQIVRRMGLQGPHASQVADILVRLYGVFKKYDAELTEINPLVISGDRVVAADARLNIDDEALFRQGSVPVIEEGTEIELRVKKMGLSYVELDGDIAVMANGAGMAMATLDILQHYGGRPANFLDAGGGASVEPTARAIEVLLETNPKAILINIFGGITRCDDVARALIMVKEQRGIPVPVVIRLVGTNEEEGVRLLSEHGFAAYKTMDEAASRVVALARGGGL